MSSWWTPTGRRMRGAVWILGGASDSFGPAYTVAPVWDFPARPRPDPAGMVGASAAKRSVRDGRAQTGRRRCRRTLRPLLVRDHQQLEAFGFCSPGEGGTFVADGNIGRAPACLSRRTVGPCRSVIPVSTRSSCSGSFGRPCSSAECAPRTRSLTRRLPSAQTGAPVPCSATFCFSVESAHEPVASAAEGHPTPPPQPPQ